MTPEQQRAAFAARLSWQANELQNVAEIVHECEDVNFAIDTIRNATGPIFTTGIGKAGLVARKVAATFTSTGTPAFFIHPVEAMHGDIGAVHDGAVVIAFSYSGETDEINRLVYTARHNKGVSVIAVTQTEKTALGRDSQIVIPLGTIEEGNIPTASTTAMMAIGDALALTVREIRGDTAEDLAKNHPGGSIGKRLGTCADYMRDREELSTAWESDDLADLLDHRELKGRYQGAVCVWKDGTEKVIGILTDSQLLRALARTKPVNWHTLAAGDMMTASPITLSPDDPITKAVEIMAQEKISELPLINKRGQLVGMLDITDLIGIFPELRE